MRHLPALVTAALRRTHSPEPARRAYLGLLVAGALAACGDGTGPDLRRYEGAYALQTVNGARVPTVIAEMDGERYTFVADTLRFSRDGTVTRMSVYHRGSTTASPADEVHRFRTTRPYSVEDGELTIGSREPCDDTAACLGVESGMISARDVMLRGTLWARDALLLFERVPED